MFCRCRNGFGGEPNTQTCPVCLAFPGALPVPNRRAIEETIKLGLALDCTIADRAVFHRKNYFYPDQPKAYQISQYDEPLCANGRLDGADARRRADDRHHARASRGGRGEERPRRRRRAASTARPRRSSTSTAAARRSSRSSPSRTSTTPRQRSASCSCCGRPSSSSACRTPSSRRARCGSTSTSPCARRGSDELRTRTELKNMNSFNFAAKGIEREIARQIRIYEEGGDVEQETLHFDPAHEESPPLRSKEEAQDYRYFPEPDLVPVQPPAELVDRLRGGDRRAARRTDRPDRRHALVLRRRRARHRRPRPALGGGRRRGSGPEGGGERAREPVRRGGCRSRRRSTPRELAKLVAARAEIPRAAFDEALAKVGEPGFSAEPYLAQKVVADAAELDPVIDRVIAGEPGPGRAVPRRQGGPARLLRRPGDEGDRRRGGPAGRERAGPRVARLARAL